MKVSKKRLNKLLYETGWKMRLERQTRNDSMGLCVLQAERGYLGSLKTSREGSRLLGAIVLGSFFQMSSYFDRPNYFSHYWENKQQKGSVEKVRINTLKTKRALFA